VGEEARGVEADAVKSSSVFLQVFESSFWRSIFVPPTVLRRLEDTYVWLTSAERPRRGD
jgi:hypothetical protein